MIDEIADPHQVTLIVIGCHLMPFSKAVMACQLPFQTFKLGEPQIACYRKEYPAQDLAGSERVSPAAGDNAKRDDSKGDGTPIGKGFLAYPENIKFGVTVSVGQIEE
jgi:hypothetical protein